MFLLKICILSKFVYCILRGIEKGKLKLKQRSSGIYTQREKLEKEKS